MSATLHYHTVFPKLTEDILIGLLTEIVSLTKLVILFTGVGIFCGLSEDVTKLTNYATSGRNLNLIMCDPVNLAGFLRARKVI